MHTIRELKIQNNYETRINHLKKCNKDLRKRLKEKNNIIKEIRELANKEDFTMKQKYEMRESILQILDKENK